MNFLEFIFDLILLKKGKKGLFSRKNRGLMWRGVGPVRM